MRRELQKISFIYRRLLNPLAHSAAGLFFAWRSEESFRIELLLALTLSLVAFVVDVTAIERILLIGSLLLVLIVEILNTAIEKTVDRISSEHHHLSKAIKDLGSAAVTLALALACVVWIALLT